MWFYALHEDFNLYLIVIQEIFPNHACALADLVKLFLLFDLNLFQIFWTMMMMGTLMTQITTSKILMNSSLLTTVVGHLELGTVELIVISFGLQCLVQHFDGLYMAVQGCCKISEDFIRWRIWSWEKECRHWPPCTWKDSEGSLKNVLRDLGIPPPLPPSIFSVLFHSYLLSFPCGRGLICCRVSLTGPVDKGLHQRGSTKPLRFCEHKAGTKAPEVRILDHQSA